jgi:HTH-type transcriptional regulator/antitoxin HigA
MAQGAGFQLTRSRFREALSEIRALTREAPEVFEPKMTALCADSGVALVIEPEIKGARVSGAARWLTASKALIQLSLRYSWEDQFWFSLFHEAGHVLRHSKKETFVHVGAGSDELEDDANFFAQTFLIPREHETHVLGLELHQIPEFAAELGISPGIVVGRLQRERRTFNWGNDLRRRFQFVPEGES